MTAYVVGFAFDQLQKVWLIRKIKPAWQKGMLNGIGGKIEPGETSVQAMSREFNEEAGVLIPVERWLMYHREKWANGNSVDFYAVKLDAAEKPKTMTDEELVSLAWMVMNRHEWYSKGVMYNLPYLVPMANVYLHQNPENMPCHAN